MLYYQNSIKLVSQNSIIVFDLVVTAINSKNIPISSKKIYMCNKGTRKQAKIFSRSVIHS